LLSEIEMNFDWLNDTTDSSFDSFTGDDLSLSPEFEFFPSPDTTWCSFPDLPPTVEETAFLGDVSPFLSSDEAFNSTEPMHVETLKVESTKPPRQSGSCVSPTPSRVIQYNRSPSPSQMEYNRVRSPPTQMCVSPTPSRVDYNRSPSPTQMCVSPSRMDYNRSPSPSQMCVSPTQMDYNRVSSPPVNLLWLPVSPPNPCYQPQMSPPIFNSQPVFSQIPYEKKTSFSCINSFTPFPSGPRKTCVPDSFESKSFC